MSDVALAIRMTADATDAAKAADTAGDAYTRMASDIDDATRKADTAASRMDGVAESSDVIASKSSQAAGGLGDLGGALSAVPGPLGAVGSGMETLAPAIMGVTGAADLLNLVTQSQVVLQTKAKASAIASAVATRAQAVATRTAAIAQRILNAVMRANLVGVIVTAVLLLVAGFVLLYKKNERFRTIVKAVFKVATAYIRGVIKVVSLLVGWAKDKLPGAWNTAKERAAAAFGAIRDKVGEVIGRVIGVVVGFRDKAAAVWAAIRDKAGSAFGAIRDKVASIVGGIRDKFTGARDAVQGVFDAIRDKVDSVMGAILGFVQPVIDKINDLVNLAGNIHLPDLNPLNRTTGGKTMPGGRTVDTSSSGGAGGAGIVINQFTINGVLNARDAVREIEQLIRRRNRSLGL